ncbi:hypothetical protein ACLQ3F_10630 [Micromonospora sp. DT15]|uniref:hypothetical protein n=1 Tax=Micromonospora sp. DT15 TaxID=3393445 RepID=UPI003CFBB7C4
MDASDLRAELEKEYARLYEDCNYSSLTYFNAAKSAELWGKGVVFGPAVVSALASLLVAFNQPRQLSALGAVASAVVATATFLGAGKRADSLKDSAKRLTALRHRVRLEMVLAPGRESDATERIIRELREEYFAIIAMNEVVSDRFFKRAQDQINKGVLEYD